MLLTAVQSYIWQNDLPSVVSLGWHCCTVQAVLTTKYFN